MIEPSIKFTLEVRSKPSVSLTKPLDHFTGYSPGLQSAGTVYVRVMIVALSAATTPKPAPCLNKKDVLLSLMPISFTYAPPLFADLYLIGDSASIVYCAPATANVVLSLLLTYALRVTVSPGYALTLSRTQSILPSPLSLTTLIAPSVNLTFFVMSKPSVSLTFVLAHLMSYVPSAQSVGTVYASVNTVAPSAATFSMPIPSSKRNFVPFPLSPIVDV